MKISICIVTYNHEEYIRQCIEGVLQQDVDFEYEIVVGEDCSTDNTRSIIEELVAQHPNKLRVQYHAKNLGAEKNFNQTISECKGEYIAFLEGDNYWTDTGKLKSQVRFLDMHQQAAFCFHRVAYLGDTGGLLKQILPPTDPEELSDIEFLFQDSNPVPLGSIVARRALLEGLADWVKGLKLGDWPLCMMLASRGKIGFIARSMSVQRNHEGSSWQNLPPVLQATYVLQMFLHIIPRLEGRAQILASEVAKNLLKALSQEVLDGPGGPLDVVKDYLKYRGLLLASSMTFLLPDKTVQRLKRSAAKREPAPVQSFPNRFECQAAKRAGGRGKTLSWSCAARPVTGECACRYSRSQPNGRANSGIEHC